MVHTFALLLALSQPIDSAQGPQASFVPVCRNGRGAWDRRSCRHVRRNDSARMVLVMHEPKLSRLDIYA